MMVGFDNQAEGASSLLCHGDDATAITNAGFAPLNNGSTAPANTGGGYGNSGTSPAYGGTSDKAGSNYREFPGDHYPTYGGSKHWTTPNFVAPT